ncbi:hypothetical protein [Vibrio tetraodonis]|uniref:hypothetical protein n=1 Tax=Vibrio tetraodonis TaxID=2231647 RepID=UPI000E0A5D70|nr:hypothetical protein [Vibrio tetraodonis]
MKNRKFSLLINEFVHLNQGSELKIDGNNVLVCHYGERQIVIEDGSRVGLEGQLILLSELENKNLTPAMAVQLNADFRFTGNGYIGRISGKNYYISNLLLPEHPQKLQQLLSQFAAQADLLHIEIKSHVVD